MNRFSFNVLSESWIPALSLDGKFEERGILGCLEDAHKIREIRSPAPIIEFGLYRLLVAFVLDTLITASQRPEDEFDLQDLMQTGSFDMQIIKDYIKECGDAFDLFHPDHPFLQTKMSNEPPKPLAGVFPATPSGTNAGLWHHKHENEMEASCQEAARLLTTIAPFMTSGGAGLSPSINGAPALYALPLGKNLFETILQNLPLRNQESGDGMIAWRNTRNPGEDRSEATTVEALTWRPRQIQLIPENAVNGCCVVRKMKFKKGDSTRLEWRDVSLAYRFEKEKTTPVRMRENRPVWRDAGPLLLLNDSEHGRDDRKFSFRRPDVVATAFDLSNKGNSVSVNVYGMRTDMKMKIFEWIKSSLIVPAALGSSTRLGGLVQGELERAEQGAFILRSTLKALYPREGEGNKNALSSLINRSEKGYWQNLEPIFHELMAAFGRLREDAADDPLLIAETAKEWRTSIRRIALDQFESVAKDMDSDSDALERLVHARTRLLRSLAKTLGEVVR